MTQVLFCTFKSPCPFWVWILRKMACSKISGKSSEETFVIYGWMGFRPLLQKVILSVYCLCHTIVGCLQEGIGKKTRSLHQSSAAASFLLHYCTIRWGIFILNIFYEYFFKQIFSSLYGMCGEQRLDYTVNSLMMKNRGWTNEFWRIRRLLLQ